MEYDIYLNKKKMGKSKKRIYSIRACTGEYKSLVRWFNSFILLKNVSFVVNEAGRQDTIKRLTDSCFRGIKARTVHAMVRGEIIKRGRSAELLYKSLSFDVNPFINYNPFKLGSFFYVDLNKPIIKAKYVFCSASEIICIEDSLLITKLDSLYS
jgi:hypothetical protein